MKRTKAFFVLRALVLGTMLLFAVAAFATATLRGQLVRTFANGARTPAGGIAVTVYNPSVGRSAPVRTDAQGMYYLNLPPGRYRLEVWVSNTPQSFDIQVNDGVTDIPPIVVR